jgi:hypothetical protein
MLASSLVVKVTVPGRMAYPCMARTVLQRASHWLLRSVLLHLLVTTHQGRL